MIHPHNPHRPTPHPSSSSEDDEDKATDKETDNDNDNNDDDSDNGNDNDKDNIMDSDNLCLPIASYIFKMAATPFRLHTSPPHTNIHQSKRNPFNGNMHLQTSN
jgi:hypothetical protein